MVPKNDGSVRICVDLKPLNASILREVHPMSTVDETLAQLTGARVFSKLVGFGRSHLQSRPASLPHSSLQWVATALISYHLLSLVPPSIFKNRCPRSSADWKGSSVKWTMSWSLAGISLSTTPGSQSSSQAY